MENKGITRRSLFKIGGIAAMGAAGASVLSACSPKEGPAAEVVTVTDGLPSFFAKPDPIEDVSEVLEYDVVVVGAGAAGVPAALSAFEAGAKVALLQKEPHAVSQGNTCDSVILDESEKAGVSALVSRIVEDCAHRSDRAQVQLWADNSGEALKWLWAHGEKAGASMVDTTKTWTSTITEMGGHKVSYFAFDFGPKPYNTGSGMRDIAAYAEGLGVDCYYSTPGRQLVQADDGSVTGIIAQREDGAYVQFNASKGVIVATGDYQNDDEMMGFYEAEMAHIGRKQTNRTGDGQKMMVWAGARMEDVPPSKVLHDFDGGPGSMADMPFLAVKSDGTRFCNEESCEMAVMGNFLKSEQDQGVYAQIFDSNYMTDCAGWPGKLYDPEAIKAYMPEEEGEKKGVYQSLVQTYKADTLEELAEKLRFDPEQFVRTVERYNELAGQGIDEDFGKESKWLKPIVQAPFYGMRRQIRLSAVIHGVNVNADMQVLDSEGQPIEGLYAIGNCAGNFYGSPDYPMTVPGLSLGRCHTQGYVVGRAVASK